LSRPSLIFRLVHTIKRTCGFLGLPRLEHVAHAAENVLGKVRDRVLTVTPDTISLVLTAVDRVKAILAGLAATGSEPPGDDSELVNALNATAAGNAPPSKAPAMVPEAVEAPPAPETEPEPTQASAPSPALQTQPPPAAPAASPTGGEVLSGEPITAQQTIRVTVDVLEDLMTLVSELVLTRNQLLQLARTQENSGFTVPLQRLSHITSDLQEGVMKMRSSRFMPINH
jgi:two-component system, chemotaxis family, sensor kinase CheA